MTPAAAALRRQSQAVVSQFRSDWKCGGGWSAAARSGTSCGCCRAGNEGSGSTAGWFELADSYSAAGGIGDLRKRETQVACLLEVGVAVNLCHHIRADTADVAHFVKDGTQLRREQQQCKT